MWNATFRLLTTRLLRAMGLTGCGTALCIMVVCCDWCISIRLLFPCTKVSPRRSLVLVQIFFLLWASTLQVFRIRCPCLCICVESYVNWGDRMTHAGKNERAQQVYTTRTHSEFRGFRACQRNRIQPAMDRNQIY